MLRAILSQRGVLALEDVQALHPQRVDHLLEITGSANLQDLYAALGSGAIRGFQNWHLRWMRRVFPAQCSELDHCQYSSPSMPINPACWRAWQAWFPMRAAISFAL